MLYSEANFQGRVFRTSAAVPDLGRFNNVASSDRVNNNQTWRFYAQKNFQGDFVEIKPRQSLANLGRLNNRIESLRAVPGR
ncbi:peptidase inhibitor family I36 protein [Microseira sp. BLCC-F43]|uniref:peptidase inhibitor family I36 protein n=1 Tax=Microseira sp. BLCC-F43 TaxID=3153602 RepID=UPI0035B99745